MLSDLSAFDLLQDAYLVLDREYNVMAANAYYYYLTGQSSSDVIGRNVFDINQHGDDAARRTRRAMLENLFHTLQYTAVAETQPTGYPLSADSTPANDRYWKIFAHRRNLTPKADVENIGYILRVQDVTIGHSQELASRKQQAILRSTAQLRQQLVLDAQRKSESDNQALKNALAFARIGAWTLDLRTGIIDCTEQCKANYGVSDDYLMTHHNLLNELIDPVDRERVAGILNDAVLRKTSFDVEYRTTWSTGETRWVMVRGIFPENDEGQSHRLSGFSLDITARKQMELESEARMQVEVDARLASETRVNAIDTFVSAISHELRSPLNAIASWAQLLDRPDQIALPKAADVIKRNVRQLSSMIEDLIDTGAVINGKLQITPQPIDLLLIASGVVEDTRLIVESKGLVLENRLSDSCFMIGDETRLRQVVHNLLANAVKFTQAGRIVVSLHVTDSEARLEVADTGIGISESDQARIFERFSQAAAGRANRAGGLGLGLWIASSIVGAHRGALHVQSAGPGCGTTFTAVFPRQGD